MINKNLPTKLFLNGPQVSFTTQPTDSDNVIGVATFTATADASFPTQSPENPAVDDGTIAFKWYYDGSQILDLSDDSDSNATITNSGRTSTITINGLKTTDNGKEVYVTADYVHTAYAQPTGSAVTAGVARSTGNATNEPLASNIVSVNIQPILQITSQPSDVTLAAGIDHDYSVTAEITPDAGGRIIEYQWQLDGNDLSDGTTSVETTEIVTTGTTGKLKLWRLGDPSHAVDGYSATNPEIFDISKTKVFGLSGNKFARQYQSTTVINFIETTEDLTFRITANGADGGTSDKLSVLGGKGGQSIGTYTFKAGQKYKMIVGQSNFSANQLDGASPKGNTSTAGGGGYGGGFTGLFIADSFADSADDVTFRQSDAILIAGGGGGGANDPAPGGAGGGLEGGDAANLASGRGGGGGTQTAGGTAGGSGPEGDGAAGTALQGAAGGGGGGGGGYFGGGAGRGTSTAGADGAGGGGSAFFYDTADTTSGRGSNVVSGIIATAGGSDVAPSPVNDGASGIHGSFFMELVDASSTSVVTKTITTTVSGSRTPNLTINSDAEDIISIVRCKVTANDVQNSPVFSDEVNFGNTKRRSIVKIEGYGTTSTATLLETNLDDGDFTMSSDNLNFDDIAFYASEKDIELEIDMYGGKGIGFDEEGGTNYNAGFQWTSGGDGAEGGYSRFNFTLKKNEEYVLRGIKSNSALFLYRKASLIAVVGQGGNGGHYGNGGRGGGVNIAGESTTSSSGGTGGTGGVLISEGELGENGAFGSRGNPSTVYPEDATSEGQSPGQTIKCSKGVYWRDQGKSACEDLGSIKFRLSDGTEVTNSATIDRGFKAGYSINSTGGAGAGDGANGGHGATGGEGHNSAGGGGGSGYSDGSINITRTQLGGGDGKARIGMRIYEPDNGFYIDDKGRILICSCTDTRDPNTLEIRTGKIFIGDNAVLDDARWQNFLNLARDGKQNWRLTATDNNSTTKITNATEKNIYKMMNANRLTLNTSMARGWKDMSYVSGYTGRKALAWDETSGSSITGTDYSMMWWVYNGNGWGHYGWSSNAFFTPTIYHRKSVNYWILPPGVPDF